MPSSAVKGFWVCCVVLLRSDEREEFAEIRSFGLMRVPCIDTRRCFDYGFQHLAGVQFSGAACQLIEVAGAANLRCNLLCGLSGPF
jgi:hypothetical protein